MDPEVIEIPPPVFQTTRRRNRKQVIYLSTFIFIFIFLLTKFWNFHFSPLLMLLLTLGICFGDHVEFNFCFLDLILDTWTMLGFVFLWSCLGGLWGPLCLLFIMQCFLRRFWWHQISVNFMVVIYEEQVKYMLFGFDWDCGVVNPLLCVEQNNYLSSMIV